MTESNSSSQSRRHSTLAFDQLVVDARTVVFSPVGDLDLWSAPQLKSLLCDLLEAGHTRIVLDLARVSFMDSTALGVLVGLQRRLGAEDRMAIAAAHPSVLRVLGLSGLATGFRVFATREAALAFVTESDAQPSERETRPLTSDAALMLGIASTAMPFARSAEDQAERWLRALRNHGEAGAVLASLGLSEAVLDEFEPEAVDPEPSAPGDPDAVATVTSHAGRIAIERGAHKLGTTDVLLAVIQVYGPIFYRVLSAHGVDPAELRTRLASTDPAPAER
jgi:anti-sigma B factor antagonist